MYIPRKNLLDIYIYQFSYRYEITLLYQGYIKKSMIGIEGFKKFRGQWQNEIKVAQYWIRAKFEDLSRINSCTVQLQVSAEHLSFPKSNPHHHRHFQL